MATIQGRKSRGNKYWYIVESRRVNGKPRPITLAYLGKANDLLRRLQGLTEKIKIKSYVHGSVAATLKIAGELNICEIINKHTQARGAIKKPIRNNLTVGATLLLAAIGRICHPTSKESWVEWANTTSLSYLLRISLEKIDSQHFRDMMEAFPASSIVKAEEEIIKKVFKLYNINTHINTETLLCDTTNFLTYIHTTNNSSEIAQRGRNKQECNDLRQLGLAIAVSKKDKLPLFHLTYEGNRHDTTVFAEIIKTIKIRLKGLGLTPDDHTLVFDRDNNSKDNLELVAKNKFHYVGALIPYQHKDIINAAVGYFANKKDETTYRTKQLIWGEERTVIVYISGGLKASQLSRLYIKLEKIEGQLKKLQQSVVTRKCDIQKVKLTIATVLGKYKQYFDYNVRRSETGKIQITYKTIQSEIAVVEEKSGFRIIMTDQHNWTDEEIINTYQGQSQIEHAFRDIKNLHYLAVNPQYHLTEQKIKVHYFVCVLGYLLATIVKVQANKAFANEYDVSNIIRQLNDIRLAVIKEDTKTPGKIKSHYRLETLDDKEGKLLEILQLKDLHHKPLKIPGLSVYN